ncbi:MAG TPA: cytochrome P450 [Steroidobacteraceae bacterium]|nr:cytochrome P450 [Steroidobacteraceae bacterium]
MSAPPQDVENRDESPRLPPLSDRQFDIGADDAAIHHMSELFHRHGDIYRFLSPARRAEMWVINHPDDVKRVLVSNHRNYTKGSGLDRVKILLGNGIMTSEGELWKRQRYMMQPMFHRKMITQFSQLIDACNERFIAKWEKQAADGALINVTDDMSELTLEIVLLSIFGTDLERLSTEMGGNPFDIVTKEPARDLKFAYRFRQLSKLVGALAKRRVAEKTEHFDFLQMLIEARDKETGAPMSERELIDEAMTLIVAGHETTASGLNWTWYLLSQNPEAEAKLHAEIDAVAEKKDPSLSEMEALSYTRNVVDEALRLYPPGWLLSRRTIAADTLSGYEVPAGTDVLLCLYLLHRHPRYWKDPDAFRPERFDAEHEAERPRFAYMPFAAGPRHCIGETLALYEMVMHLYKVARRYRLRYVPDRELELEAQINLRTKHPLMMKLERRT